MPDKLLNFRVVFYSDMERKDAVRLFDLRYGSPDLNLAYVDNTLASELWTTEGLLVEENNEHLIQVYPDITTPEIACGIPYYTRLLKQTNGGNWEEVEVSHWAENIVDGSKQDFDGISSATLSDELSVVYAIGSDLKLATRNSQTQVWDKMNFSEIFSDFTDTTKSSPIVTVAENTTQIAYADQLTPQKTVLRLISKIGNTWNNQPITTSTQISDINIVDQNGHIWIYYRSQEGLVSYINSAHIITVDSSDSWQIDTLVTGEANDCYHRVVRINDDLHIVYNKNNNILHQSFTDEWGVVTLLDSGQLIGRPAICETAAGFGVIYSISVGGLESVKLAENIGGSFSVSTIYQTGLGETLQAPISAISVRDVLNVLFGTSSGLKISTREQNNWLTATLTNRTVYDAQLDIANGHPAIVTSEDSTPSGVIPSARTTSLVVYLYNGAEVRTPGLASEFKCDCASSIFEEPSTHIDLLSTWAEIRLTDTNADCLRPQIQSRHSSDAMIVTYQSKSGDSTRIHGGVYRKANQNRMFSTGSKSWFDYDFATDGSRFGFANDFYDAVVLARVNPRSTGLPGLANDINTSVYKFNDSEDPADYPPAFDTEIGLGGSIYRIYTDGSEDLIVSDPYISKHLVRKIRITNVDRLTYNSSGSVVPAVSSQLVQLLLYGTPEVYAFRLRNENGNYGGWLPWSPELGRYYTETNWKLSSNPGLKQICVQLMTYAGKTTEFCIQLIADYQLPVVDIKLYYKQNNAMVELPRFNLMPVAAINDQAITLSHLQDNLVLLQDERTVYVEIATSSKITDGFIYFSVIQQGTHDIIRKATDPGYVELTDHRMGYKGSFDIHTEDYSLHKDGLARIIVSFPED